MAPVFKQLDFFKLSGRGYTNFACTLSDDDRVVILSEIGLYVVAIKPNLDNSFTELSCQKTFIPISKYSICDNVELDLNTFVHELPRESIYESIARIELSSNMNGTALVEPLALTAIWSNSGMVEGTDCLLGVLTQLYSLDIYMRYVNESEMTEYRIVLNITEEILKRKKSDFIYSNRFPVIQKYIEFKNRVDSVAPVAFCWSHTYNVDNHANTVIFAGHLHGFISIWKVFCSHTNSKELECAFLGEYKTTLGDISCVHWYKTQEFGGALCVGDIDGRIVILQIIDLDKSQCVCDNEVQFCQDKDHMVDKLTLFNINEYTVLVAVKQCYLFFYVINGSGSVTDFSVHSVENLYITGISYYDKKLQVLTFTGSFKELTLSIHYGKISIEEKVIPLKIEPGFRTHGFIVTKQRILTGIFLSPYKLTNSIKGKQFVYFNLFYDSNINPLQKLMDNESGTLAKHWDCIETLRLLCLKEQRFPWLGIDPLMDYDSLSLHKLKVMRIIAKLSETVFVAVKEVRNYDIKPFILLQYLVDIKLIVERLVYLFDLMYSGKKLSPFQLTSMELQVFFLKEIVVSGILLRAEVGKHFIEEITKVLQVANELTFPDMIRCRLCGEKLIGATCLPPHSDARCCLTMHPIFLMPTYKCYICGSLAHHEAFLERKDTSCPYCDIPMQKISIEPSIKNAIKLDSDKDVKSPCFTDCLTDGVDYEELEDNDIEVLFVSDDEVEEEGEALIDVYSRISKLNLDDTSDNWHVEPVSN
ncbi:uncharacterized protein LOC143203805 isoform X1 [Rhynchophorus ferrugineus]|uniref:uncharacterized protein LOC143203805 isoform X1 n=2 Tax=Rhynchophorus ferrugineus TaxID=354439 RepID=UPI003FCCFB00